MDENEYYTADERVYINPTLSRDEQTAFIDNLRSTQTAANQQIEDETRGLGMQVPTNLGGLTSGATSPDSYFMSRLQTPQVNSQVATLNTTAQASALNDVLNNYKAQLANKIAQRQRDYNRASRRYGLRRGGGGGTTPGNSPEYPATPGDVKDVPTTKKGTIFGNRGVASTSDPSGTHVSATSSIYNGYTVMAKQFPDKSVYYYYVDDEAKEHQVPSGALSRPQTNNSSSSSEERQNPIQYGGMSWLFGK